MIYNIGDVAILYSGAFTRLSDDVVLDPTTVTVRVKTPSGAERSYVYGTDAGVIRDSLGNFHFDLDLTESGDWYYRWIGTGACVAASEATIDVAKSAFVSP